MRRIYHYAPLSPHIISCGLRECSYLYTDDKAKVNCKECLKTINKTSEEIAKYERRHNEAPRYQDHT